MKGNRVIVEIIGKEEKANDYVNTKPGDIICDKEGVVSKVYVAQGVAKVKKGDIVFIGDVLISGEVTSEHADTRYVGANGEVIIKTWYVEKYKVPYTKSIVSKSGNKEKSYAFDIFNCKINFLNKDTKFEKYDTITSSNNFNLFGKFDIPIKVITQTYEEVVIDNITYTKKQAEDMAKDLVKKSVLAKVPIDATIVDEKINIIEGEDGIEAEIIIECEEKAGVYKRSGG